MNSFTHKMGVRIGVLCTITITALVLGTIARPASAGTLILEGSDAVGEHCTQGGDPGACTYRDELWTAIGGADSRSIAVIGDVGGIGSNTHAVSDFSSVAAAGTLSDYVALYFTASGGCCSENDSIISAPADVAAIQAYYNGGGTIVIENYTGDAAWDFLVGAGGNGNAHVAGYLGGAGGNNCSDGEAVTADGTLNGFQQPPAIGCWTHQSYEESFFGALGFTHNFFDAPSDIGGQGFSSLLSTGITVSNPEAAPEPATLGVMGLGLAGLAAIRRRRAQK